MRVVSIEQLKRILASLPENPRVVASGNFATPHGAARRTRRGGAGVHPAHAQRPEAVCRTARASRTRPRSSGPGMRNNPAARLHPLPAEPGARSCSATTTARRRPAAHVDAPPRHGQPGHRGQHPARGDRVGARARRPRDRPGQSATCPTPTATRRSTSTRSTTSSRSTSRCPRTRPGELDDVSRQIGELIAARVQDDSTLQLGIGAVPDAVLASLTAAARACGSGPRCSATACSS